MQRKYLDSCGRRHIPRGRSAAFDSQLFDTCYVLQRLLLFTFCVHFCTVFHRAVTENGSVIGAYHVLHTRHSRIKLSRSPESIWN
jgi:hypothetical protein